MAEFTRHAPKHTQAFLQHGMFWQDLSIQLLLNLLVIHGHCEVPKKLSTNKHYASSSGTGSAGVRPALRSLYLIHFLVKRASSHSATGRHGDPGQCRVGGLGVGEQRRRPLAAHSMIINDHPAGLKSGPGEKTDTELTLRDQMSQWRRETEGKKHTSQEWRGEMRWVVLWLENGDRTTWKATVSHNSDGCETDECSGWIERKEIIVFICISIRLHTSMSPVIRRQNN